MIVQNLKVFQKIVNSKSRYAPIHFYVDNGSLHLAPKRIFEKVSGKINSRFQITNTVKLNYKELPLYGNLLYLQIIVHLHPGISSYKTFIKHPIHGLIQTRGHDESIFESTQNADAFT